MARYWFGGSIADWTFISETGEVTVGAVTGRYAVVVGGQEVTLWTAETGGAQVTDLLDVGGNPVTSVTSSDGTDARAAGQIPPVQGPNDVTELWASGGGGPRALMTARLGGQVQAVTAQAATTAAGLQSHAAARNPHNTRFTDLADASASAPINGQVYVYNSSTGKFVPTTLPSPPERLYVRKPLDETINNLGALQDDDHLFVPVAANAVYEMRLRLYLRADPVGDFKSGWSYPVGTTLWWTAVDVRVGTTDGRVTETDVLPVVTNGPTWQTQTYEGVVVVGSTAGTLRLRWAQNGAASGSGATVQGGSMLMLDRVQ